MFRVLAFWANSFGGTGVIYRVFGPLHNLRPAVVLTNARPGVTLVNRCPSVTLTNRRPVVELTRQVSSDED